MTAPPSLQFEFKAGGLTVRVNDRSFLEQKEASFTSIAASIQELNPRATLVDLWHLPGLATFMDRFELGEMAGRYLANLTLAVLVRPDQADPRRIGQLAARNRGAHVELFTDRIAAEAWLAEQTRPETPAG